MPRHNPAAFVVRKCKIFDSPRVSSRIRLLKTKWRMQFRVCCIPSTHCVWLLLAFLAKQRCIPSQVDAVHDLEDIEVTICGKCFLDHQSSFSEEPMRIPNRNFASSHVSDTGSCKAGLSPDFVTSHSTYCFSDPLFLSSLLLSVGHPAKREWNESPRI